MQIDKNRTDPIILKLKTFNSPISLQEHKTHLAISHLTFKNEDPELISVTAEPKDAQMYVKIQNLIKDIQHEFDLSWAILGETYGFLPDKKPKIKFRRITSNLEHSIFLRKLDYVPKNINLKVSNEVAKLLVAPLYGDSPTFGVRELVQNATDACKERIAIERDKGNNNYYPLVKVSIDMTDNNEYIFKIEDNGKGMTLDEIQNYFLSVGTSLRKTVEWKREFEGKVSRNGRFGIGVLAGFLLGAEINVNTKSYKADTEYCFRAKLNDENVEVKKTFGNSDVGTKIEILMPEQKYYKLVNEQHKGISWMDWYVGEIPKVEYLINGKMLKPALTFSPSKIRFFTPQSKEYEKIRWEYLEEWKNNTNILLVCNDIVITRSYPNQRFIVSDIDDNDNYAIGKYVIIDKPCIFVEDTKGNFPLKLDRNGLDVDKLPFEDDLQYDLSKDFIAQLLMTPTSMNTQTVPDFSPHKTDFLYLTNGFALASDFFMKKLSTQYKFLKIELHDSEDVFKYKSILLSELSEYILIPYFYHTSEYISILDDGGVCLFRKDHRLPRRDNELSYRNFRAKSYPERENTDIYDYFIKNDRRNLDKIEWIDDNYFIFNNKKDTTDRIQSNTLNIKWLSIIKKLNYKVILIEEIPLQYIERSTLRGGKILNELFEKYLGSDVVIPYDMEKRVEKYPKAFKDLRDYMKDYEKHVT